MLFLSGFFLSFFLDIFWEPSLPPPPPPTPHMILHAPETIWLQLTPLIHLNTETERQSDLVGTRSTVLWQTQTPLKQNKNI